MEPEHRWSGGDAVTSRRAAPCFQRPFSATLYTRVTGPCAIRSVRAAAQAGSLSITVILPFL